MDHAKLRALREEMRKPESAAHDLSTRRFQAVRAFDAEMAALRGNLPAGVMQASARILRDGRSRFAVVTTHQPGESIHKGTVGTTEVGVRRDGDTTIAFDARTGKALGEMNDMATSPRGSWPSDLVFHPNPIRDAAYLGLAYGSTEASGLSPTVHALPLEGPLLDHPAFARMAKAARRILDNQFDALQVVRRVDRDAARNQAEQEVLRAKVQAVLDGAIARVSPDEANPRLARLVRTMDWTFDEADRTHPEDHEQRDAIRQGLNALDPDDAVAYVGIAGWGWTYALRLLNEHPQVRKAA